MIITREKIAKINKSTDEKKDRQRSLQAIWLTWSNLRFVHLHYDFYLKLSEKKLFNVKVNEVATKCHHFIYA